jgi:hypothetical protein
VFVCAKDVHTKISSISPHQFAEIHFDFIAAPNDFTIIRTILTTSISCQENCVSSEQTRRTFLKVSALGIAATSTARFSAAIAAPLSADITVRVTGGTQRYAAATSLSWKTGETNAANVVTLDPTKKYQDILGFGAAFTDAACYTFNRLDPSVRASLFHELFHPSEVGLNVCRTCIG